MDTLPLELWLDIFDYCSAVVICRLSLCDIDLKSYAWDYLSYFNFDDDLQSAQGFMRRRTEAAVSRQHLLQPIFQSIKPPHNLRYLSFGDDLTFLSAHAERLIASVGNRLKYLSTGSTSICTANIIHHLDPSRICSLNIRLRSLRPGDVEAFFTFTKSPLEKLKYLTLAMDSKVAIQPTLEIIAEMQAPQLSHLRLDLARLYPVFNISQTFGSALSFLRHALSPHKENLEEFCIISSQHLRANLHTDLLQEIVQKEILENPQKWSQIPSIVLNGFGIEIWQVRINSRTIFDIILRSSKLWDVDAIFLLCLACHPNYLGSASALDKFIQDLMVLMAVSTKARQEIADQCFDWVLARLHSIIQGIRGNIECLGASENALFDLACELVRREASSANVKALKDLVEISCDRLIPSIISRAEVLDLLLNEPQEWIQRHLNLSHGDFRHFLSLEQLQQYETAIQHI